MKSLQELMNEVARLKNSIQPHQTVAGTRIERELFLVAAQEHLDDTMDALEDAQNYDLQAEDDNEEV